MGLLSILLLPLSAILAAILRVRHFLYDIGVFRSYRSRQCFMVVVGNLNLGGTGKTPYTEFLIRHFSRHYQIVVLSRGYGRKTRGFREVLPDSSPEECGDEPVQIKQNFPDVTVVVCENRAKGIKIIEEQWAPDWIVLDDAYQHRAVKGHIEILLTPYRLPYFKDHLYPAGTLRDVTTAANRANYLVVTKGPQETPSKMIRYVQRYSPFFFGEDLFFSHLEYDRLIEMGTGQTFPPEHFDRIILVTAIARPEPIVKYFEDMGIRVVQKSYPDHYHYKQEDIRLIRVLFDNFEPEKTALVTTYKDYHKLLHTCEAVGIQLNWHVIPVRVCISDDRETYFLELLEDRYRAFKSKIK